MVVNRVLKYSLVKDHNPGSVAFLQTEGDSRLRGSGRFIQAFHWMSRFLFKPLSHHLQQEKPASEKLLIYWFSELKKKKKQSPIHAVQD